MYSRELGNLLVPPSWYNVGMPKRLTSKPCRHCGAPVAGIKRPDRNAYRYPKCCETCRPLVGPRGEAHPRWNGGRSVGIKGYVYIVDPATGKRVLEHKMVWERANGPRPPGHHIHHINGIRSDNRLENLVLMEAQAHIDHHHQPLARWAKKYDRCTQCGTTDSRHYGRGLCKRCALRMAWHRARTEGRPWAQPAPRVSAWARQHARCSECGTTEIPHGAKGLCERCYSRVCDQRRPRRVKH